jgi:hypothetical protein
VTGEAGQLQWTLQLWVMSSALKIVSRKNKKLVDLMDELLVTGEAGQLQRTLQLWVMSSSLKTLSKKN